MLNSELSDSEDRILKALGGPSPGGPLWEPLFCRETTRALLSSVLALPQVLVSRSSWCQSSLASRCLQNLHTHAYVHLTSFSNGARPHCAPYKVCLGTLKPPILSTYALQF